MSLVTAQNIVRVYGHGSSQFQRSEERRVGKECRARSVTDQ